jgi:hypothetical protein
MPRLTAVKSELIKVWPRWWMGCGVVLSTDAAFDP